MSEEQMQDMNQETVDVNDRDFTQPQEVEKQSEAPELESDALPEAAEAQAQTIDDLPLPTGKDESEKSDLPKWAEKRLSKKDREIAQKAAEAEMYRAELEKLKQGTPANPAQYDIPEIKAPNREDYANEDDYIDARFDYRQKKAAIEQQAFQRQNAMLAAEQEFRQKWNSAWDEGAKKYEDFEDVANVLNHPGFPPNRAMAEAIVDSNHKHDILYFLGTYTDKAKEIARMNPVQAIKEIAKLEARFTAARKANVTKASAPVVPLKNNQGQGANPDPNKMDQEDYVQWYEKNYGKKRLLK